MKKDKVRVRRIKKNIVKSSMKNTKKSIKKLTISFPIKVLKRKNSSYIFLSDKDSTEAIIKAYDKIDKDIFQLVLI